MTGGLRYTHEGKTIDNLGAFPRSTCQPSFFPVPSVLRRDVARRLDAESRIGDPDGKKTLTYVSATRGFKSGGFNFTSSEPGRGYAPEWAWSYEGGAKTRVADGRTSLSSLFFRPTPRTSKCRRRSGQASSISRRCRRNHPGS